MTVVHRAFKDSSLSLRLGVTGSSTLFLTSVCFKVPSEELPSELSVEGISPPKMALRRKSSVSGLFEEMSSLTHNCNYQMHP